MCALRYPICLRCLLVLQAEARSERSYCAVSPACVLAGCSSRPFLWMSKLVRRAFISDANHTNNNTKLPNR